MFFFIQTFLKRGFLFCFLLFSPFLSGNEMHSNKPLEKKVILTIKSHSKAKTPLSASFTSPTRLSEILTQASAFLRASQKTPSRMTHASDSIYWPAAGLFDDTQAERIHSKLKKIERQLKGLEKHWTHSPEKVRALQSLRAFIKSSQFKTRLLKELDEDLYLSGGIFNPLLHGSMTLILPSQPTSVWVIGGVKRNTALPFISGKSINQYLERVPELYQFNVNDVVIISPNGITETYGVAYWNTEEINVAPGSLIFVPFQDLPPRFSSLNDALCALFQDRVL